MGGISSFVGNVAGAVGDVVGGAADVVEDVAGGVTDVVEDVVGGVSDVVEDIGGGIADVVDDVWDTASDVVEDAWDNDLIRTAALAAGAYYGGTYLLETFAPSIVDSAFLAGYSPNAAGVVGYGFETLATSSFARGVAGELTGEIVGGALGGGGGGGRGFAPMRLSRGPSTQYGNFGARVAELGINADVADGMMKVANSDLEALQQFRRDVNRTATLGPTIELGSAQLGGIGVRSETRDIS